MSEAKYRELVESIRRIGFVQHALVRSLEDNEEEFEIVDGHHRCKAMRELGELFVPCIVLEGDEDPRVVALAMNRLRGETDLAVASIMIEELMDAGLSTEDLSITGFSAKELQDLVDALESPDDPSLDDIAGTDVPEEIGSDVARPFLLELTFRSKADLDVVRRALRKAAGKGVELGEGLMRLIRPE